MTKHSKSKVNVAEPIVSTTGATSRKASFTKLASSSQSQGETVTVHPDDEKLHQRTNDNDTKVPDHYDKDSRIEHFLARPLLRRIKKQQQIHAKNVMEFDYSNRLELHFVRNPTFNVYLKLSREFDNNYMQSDHPKFNHLEPILLAPSAEETTDPTLDHFLHFDKEKNISKLDNFPEKSMAEFKEEKEKTKKRAKKRDALIEKKGKGFGGHMTTKVLKAKGAAYYTKNTLTLRGTVFRINDEVNGKSIIEMLPRYRSRKGKHVAVRIVQFMANASTVALGYGLAGTTFGLSIIAANQCSIIITLTGEGLALFFDGAEYSKILSHLILRGAELESLALVPIVGKLVGYGENALFGFAAAGIVLTTLADMIFEKICDRYTSSISLDDLGNPSCLNLLNQRIDYLSRFLIPYGQYLYLKEMNPIHKQEILRLLRRQFRLLKHLEHKNIKALNFYRLALLAGRVPSQVHDSIENACQNAEKDIRVHSHRTARKCLTTLLHQAVPTELDHQNFNEFI